MSIKLIKAKPEFVDERGYITRLIDQDDYPIRAILYISSKAGTTRGNHYHKKDVHYVYCLSGKFRYSAKDMNKKNSKVESVVMKPGDLVLSPPTVAHAMDFLEDTVFLAFTTERRDHKKYEEDTVRLNLK